MPLIRSAFLSAVALACLTTPAHAGTPDPFGPRTGLTADTALYLDALSGSAEAVERLRAHLQQTPAPADSHDAWSFLCALDFHKGRYARAIPECEKAVALNPDAGDANTLANLRLLAHEAPPRAQGSARVPVSPGVRVPVTSGAFEGRALADTGAQISVIMQSVARSAHVKVLGASGEVTSSTASVRGQIGVIPEVKIGGAVLQDIPVLVLPDSQLTASNGRETVVLPFILSVYALAQFGRVAWLDHDHWLVLGDAAPAPLPGAVPMIWHPKGIAVPLEGPGGRLAAQFDSGADTSSLFAEGTALLSAAERARIVNGTRRIASLGATVEQEVRRVPRAGLMLAGQPLMLRNLDIVSTPATGEAARLGEDVLQAYSAVVFDFVHMTFSVSP